MAVDAQRILEVFWWFDRNGDGVISRDELARVLKALRPDAWDDRSINALLSAADTNKDGIIQYEEFVAWLTGTDITWKQAREEAVDTRAADATKLQDEADVLADSIARDTAAIEQATTAANDGLEAALPALEAATEALASLEAQDLIALAALEAPPAGRLLLAVRCVAVLRPLAPAPGGAEGWEVGRALLADPGLLRALRHFDKDGVQEDQVRAVRRLLEEQPEAAPADGGQAASEAAAPKWQSVNELHKRVGQSERELERVSEALKALRAGAGDASAGASVAPATDL